MIDGLARILLSGMGLCRIYPIERAAERFAAVSGGKLTPLQPMRGKLLPLDSDSSFKRIAHVITCHSLCRHRDPAGGEYSPSQPWPQKGLDVGPQRRFLEQHGRSNSGWLHAKPVWQLVQF